MTSESTLYRPWLHRISVFIAIITFCLVVAGALVTSEDAGLSVPDWPTSYGHLFKLPPWVGGIVFEHTHRMIGEFTGLCTVAIAFWILFAERRRWMKVLAFVALGVVIVQGVLGGITVRHYLPPSVSTAHAAVGQTFFAIAVLIAVFTSRKWVEETPQVVPDAGHPKLLVLCFYSIFILYVQLILGGMFRHHGMPWWPHVVNAACVTVLLGWTGICAIRGFRGIPVIRRNAMIMVHLLAIQLLLGYGAYYTRIVMGAYATEPDLITVLATVTHVAVGALLLASTAVLTVHTWRNVALVRSREVPANAITA